MDKPLMIQIGLHYYCCAGEFDPARINAPAVRCALNSFVSGGLLEKLDKPNEYGATYRATDGLAVWWVLSVFDPKCPSSNYGVS